MFVRPRTGHANRAGATASWRGLALALLAKWRSIAQARQGSDANELPPFELSAPNDSNRRNRTGVAEAARAMTPAELAGLKRIRAMGDIQAGELVHPEAKTLSGAGFAKAYPDG